MHAVYYRLSCYAARYWEYVYHNAYTEQYKQSSVRCSGSVTFDTDPDADPDPRIVPLTNGSDTDPEPELDTAPDPFLYVSDLIKHANKNKELFFSKLLCSSGS
jgi:hypothetical protein